MHGGGLVRGEGFAVDASIVKADANRQFHDLRHAFASNLLAAGTDIVTVSKALGHANVHITLTTYPHAIPGTTGRWRRFGAIDGAERKQNGNIGAKTGDNSEAK